MQINYFFISNLFFIFGDTISQEIFLVVVMRHFDLHMCIQEGWWIDIFVNCGIHIKFI